MPSPTTRNSKAWARAGLSPRFQKLSDEPTEAGSGRYGKVLRAWDSEQDRYVAVKMSHKGRPSAIRSILREFEAMQGLNHPAVLGAIAYGRRDAGSPLQDRAYLVTDWVAGATLKDSGLGSKPHAVILGVLEGLAYLHHHGLYHRDLHRQNILRNEDRAVIIDFGLARRPQDAEELEEDAGLDMRLVMDSLKESTGLKALRDALGEFSKGPVARAWRGGEPPSAAVLLKQARCFDSAGLAVPESAAPASKGRPERRLVWASFNGMAARGLRALFRKNLPCPPSPPETQAESPADESPNVSRETSPLPWRP